MTENKRIALNVAATYGRSLYALVIGLFCGRWTLMALGEVDYGLMGVVGGMIGFVAFFNSLMAGAVGRFYAFAVGEAQKAGNESAGLENCRRWFNVAVLIHTVLPTVLVAIGYPAGVWAVENYLVIPPDRIGACIWVWRFSCIACFVGMVNVPFQAMYTAKQEIAELTIYGFVTTTLQAGFLYYMITHPGFWLVKFSAWTCFLGVVPALLICTMAFVRYPECRIRIRCLWDPVRMKELAIYAGGRFICAFSLLIRSNAVTVLVNKILGPAKNAALSISNMVASHAMTLSGSLVGAFSPAITNAAGANDLPKMRQLSFSVCKYGALSILLFAIPLGVEMDNVLRLWLVTPPHGVSTLCVCLLCECAISKMVDGHWIAVFAMGKTFAFSITESVGYYASFFLIWGFILLGFDIVSVGMGIIACSAYTVCIKLYWGRRLCGLSIRHWIRRVVLPISIIVLFVLSFAVVPRLMMQESFLRVVVTTIISESLFIPLTWCIALEGQERRMVIERLKARLPGGNLKGQEGSNG